MSKSTKSYSRPRPCCIGKDIVALTLAAAFWEVGKAVRPLRFRQQRLARNLQHIWALWDIGEGQYLRADSGHCRT